MKKATSTIMVDRRIMKFIEITERKDGICSATLLDMDETFWFDNKVELQKFLNTQARERFYDKSLREGYFDYVDENNQKHRYNIVELKRGKILKYKEVII